MNIKNDHLIDFPSFSLKCTNDLTVTNSIFKNKNIILFVFPKINTPTCTKQSNDFSLNYEEFLKENYQIYGLSNDKNDIQKKFQLKNDIKYNFLSDTELLIIKKLNCWVEKKMYGKKFFGSERTTFVIQDNKIIKIWKKVKIKNHIQEILDFIKK
tara:strand:+ start:300 stop:764 length:465 start_codon:yes stop_codon:yes gene_type:complete